MQQRPPNSPATFLRELMLQEADQTSGHQRLGKILRLRHFSPDCRLLQQAGPLVKVNIMSNPDCLVLT